MITFYKIVLSLCLIYLEMFDTVFLELDTTLFPIKVDLDNVRRQEEVELLLNTHTFYGNINCGIWVGPGDYNITNLIKVGTIWFYLGLIAVHFVLKKVDIIYI